jgi:hypothetical protein
MPDRTPRRVTRAALAASAGRRRHLACAHLDEPAHSAAEESAAAEGAGVFGTLFEHHYINNFRYQPSTQASMVAVR